MPPPLPEDEGSDVEANGVEAHTESKIEADVEAKDQLKDDLMEDIEETKGKKAAKAEKRRVSPTASNADDDEDEEDAYEVEAIRGHEWRRKNKKSKAVLLYNVKWKGWPESENTLEPVSNLQEARDLLAAYHHSIGGEPAAEDEGATSLKKKSSRKSLRQDSMASGTEDSAAPPSKRQKRKQEDAASDDDDDAGFGNWMPTSSSWEKSIKEIQTVERDEKSNDLYILMIFKNGKKSRIKNSLVRNKCPQKLLDFYEAHLSV